MCTCFTETKVEGTTATADKDMINSAGSGTTQEGQAIEFVVNTTN